MHFSSASILAPASTGRLNFFPMILSLDTLNFLLRVLGCFRDGKCGGLNRPRLGRRCFQSPAWHIDGIVTKLPHDMGENQNPYRIPLTKSRSSIDYASFDPGVASDASNGRLRNLIKFCTTRDEKDIPTFQTHQKTPARFSCPDENQERAWHHSSSSSKRPQTPDSKRR